jgi:hypothetical protein
LLAVRPFPLDPLYHNLLRPCHAGYFVASAATLAQRSCGDCDPDHRLDVHRASLAIASLDRQFAEIGKRWTVVTIVSA